MLQPTTASRRYRPGLKPVLALPPTSSMLVEGGKKQRGSRVRQLEALYKALIVAMGDQAGRARLKLRYRGHVHVHAGSGPNASISHLECCGESES